MGEAIRDTGKKRKEEETRTEGWEKSKTRAKMRESRGKEWPVAETAHNRKERKVKDGSEERIAWIENKEN